jgi:hypothetical protein
MTRTVICVDNTFSTVASSLCDPTATPPTTQDCNPTACESFLWQVHNPHNLWLRLLSFPWQAALVTQILVVAGLSKHAFCAWCLLGAGCMEGSLTSCVLGTHGSAQLLCIVALPTTTPKPPLSFPPDNPSAHMRYPLACSGGRLVRLQRTVRHWCSLPLRGLRVPG